MKTDTLTLLVRFVQIVNAEKKKTKGDKSANEKVSPDSSCRSNQQ